MSAALVRGIDAPEVVALELLDAIRAGMARHPRSLQKAIGPSSIGDPCSRRLLHALAGERPPEGFGNRDGWLATIGTATHAWLPQWFPPPRYLAEVRVPVGELDGQQITGSADLFDIESATVVDWKLIGPDRLEEYRRHGPGAQYRTQIQLYAYGLTLLGYEVRTVMIVMLPRNGGLATAYTYFDDYVPEVATAAMDRLRGLSTLLGLLGLPAAKDNFPLCNDWLCHWCRIDRPRTIPTTTAELIGGRKV